METVAMILTSGGKPISVYADEVAARAVCDRMNADPMLDAETPDPDAPYAVETWSVR